MKIKFRLAFLWYFLLIPALLFQCLSCNPKSESPHASQLPDSMFHQKRDKGGSDSIVFRSADNGQTWQDISDGLPVPTKDEYGVDRNVFFADDSGLWLSQGNGVCHTETNSAAPFWTDTFFPGEAGSISPGRKGVFAYHYQHGILQKTIGSSKWTPVFTNFKDRQVRGVFETAGGTLFISTGNGLFKSADNGKNWKLLPAISLGGKIVESKGVLLTTGTEGIMQSTDDGESWHWVISEGGVGIDVANINGGFAAITYSSVFKTRRIRTSYDGGNTWQAIDAGFPGHGFTDSPLQAVNNPTPGSNDSVWHPQETASTVQEYKTSVVQVGENFFCGHTDGIYKKSDKGKTWKLVLPAAKGKMFKLAVSGNVIYAIQMESHC